MMMTRVLFAIGFVLASFAQGAAQTDAAEARREVERAVAAYNEATNAGDAQRLRDLLAEDFRLRWPNGKVIRREEMQFPLAPDETVSHSRTFTIEEFKLKGGEAILEVSYTVSSRHRLPNGSIYESGSTSRQRETWAKTAAGWKLRLVDDIKVKSTWATLDGKKPPEGFRPPVPESAAHTPVEVDRPVLAAGHALVFVFRLRDGSPPRASLFVDGAKVAEMPGGNFIKLRLAPGRHELRSDLGEPVALDTEAGKIYYFWLKFKPGLRERGGVLEREVTSFSRQAYRLPSTLDLKALAAEHVKDASKVVAAAGAK